MRPKNNIDSVCFNDGYLYLYTLDTEGDIDYRSARLFYFGRRTVTLKRMDEAAQIQQSIDMCVHIPYTTDDIVADNVVSIGTAYYRIISVQHIHSTNPPITVLSLERWSMETGYYAY